MTRLFLSLLTLLISLSSPAMGATIGTRGFWVDARVAYRELLGSDYTVIWPKDLYEFKVT